jgi:hypothetical protein
MSTGGDVLRALIATALEGESPFIANWLMLMKLLKNTGKIN